MIQKVVDTYYVDFQGDQVLVSVTGQKQSFNDVLCYFV